jgi:arsenate reductase (glutaredoxin)
MNLNIQLMGTKKCRDTQKAERFFKDRRIPFQFRDLADKGISQGELNNISSVIPPEDLIDKEGKEYEKKGMKFKVFNISDELLENPLLLKTPIVRNGRKVTVGYQPQTWLEWLKEK